MQTAALASKNTLAESKELFSAATSAAQAITANKVSNTTANNSNNVSSNVLDKPWLPNGAEAQRLLKRIESRRTKGPQICNVTSSQERPLCQPKPFLEKQLPAPLDEDVAKVLYKNVSKTQVNTPVQKFLKSSQNFNKTKKSPMPAMDLTKLKKSHQKTRNYVAISHTHRKVREKDLLFINESSFTQLGSSYGVSNKTLKKAAHGGGMVVKSMN